MNRAGRALGYRAATAVTMAISVAVAISVAMVAVLLTGCLGDASSDTQVLQIGVIGPFSGHYESLGRSVRDGVLLAAEAWNQQGGVLGFEVQVVLEDSACDYQGGRAAADAAIDAGAPFLIGAVCAGASEGVAQVATRSGVLQITPGSVNLDLTLDAEEEVRDLVYRIPSVDDDQGAVAARFALEQLGHETAAVLYAEDSTYGSALARAFVRVFEEGEVARRRCTAFLLCGFQNEWMLSWNPKDSRDDHSDVIEQLPA